MSGIAVRLWPKGKFSKALAVLIPYIAFSGKSTSPSTSRSIRVCSIRIPPKVIAPTNYKLFYTSDCKYGKTLRLRFKMPCI